jgi:hypothetical protein
MKTLRIQQALVGGAIETQAIEADRFEISFSGALQIWRGSDLITAIAASRWLQYEERAE